MIRENIKIKKIEEKLISLGSFSKKYTSDGKISILNALDKKTLINSIFFEIIIPKNTPAIVANTPIEKPVKKNAFFIELLLNPKVFKIAISLVLFLINILN